MRRLLKNATIVRPYTAIPFLENGYVVVEGDTISAVGAGLPAGERFDEVIDLEGKIVLPGMINAHTHLYSALALGMPPPRKPPAGFPEILKQVWWKLDRALDSESTRAAFEVGLLNCLRCGVTTIFDHHSSQNFISGSLELLIATAEKLGVNISTAFEITDRNGRTGFTSGLSENLSVYKKYQNQKYVHPMLGMHASFTLSDESLQAIRTALDTVDQWGIHIHVAEDKIDRDDARSRGYRSIIDRLRRFDLLNDRSLIIHGLYLEAGDVETIKACGASLVHNPTSNANNRVGLLSTQVINTLEAGLGTDGMQANMLAEAKEGTLIRSSHLKGGTDNIDYAELLFKHNPRIAGRLFGRDIGLIAPGCQADLAVYRCRTGTPVNKANLAGHLLFGWGLPTDVMTRGRFRIRNQKFVNLSEEDVLSNARIQSERLWRKMGTIG